MKRTTNSNRRKILLMDDDLSMRKSSNRLLKYLGCEISLAQDGREAIDLYKEALYTGRPFDAVIMDITIPEGMGGEEAIRELIKIDPDVKAIVSTDLSNGSIIANFQKYGFCAPLIKPYGLTELQEVLHEIIK